MLCPNCLRKVQGLFFSVTGKEYITFYYTCVCKYTFIIDRIKKIRRMK